ncbi:uncharacterized protein FFB20_13023 [Fusarium fujikuroi]|nr:uncharacterized protein Y057_8864 [Fusarium fujikuroi]QGI58118.1 hypothetical protein CEK27_000243 [Fusarium fujikuroi]QGI75338.1 hypothetical protein CEK25_000244 [Fusarium fujikuroi]QGI89031.1 hypothetical protein CEK26_000246 [Fusarium fujikuroi]SCN74022.1 uncharacterized protein FFC1_01940 [Fusarium fujikuroi]
MPNTTDAEDIQTQTRDEYPKADPHTPAPRRLSGRISKSNAVSHKSIIDEAAKLITAKVAGLENVENFNDDLKHTFKYLVSRPEDTEVCDQFVRHLCLVIHPALLDFYGIMRPDDEKLACEKIKHLMIRENNLSGGDIMKILTGLKVPEMTVDPDF